MPVDVSGVPPLTWIASYPRSGNDWMRVLLAGYLLDGPVPSMDALRDTVPDFVDLFHRGRLLPVDGSGPRAVKTHFRPGVEVMRRYAPATGKVVYLVRDPRDVLLSAIRALEITPDRRPTFAQGFLQAGGVPNWTAQGRGTWAHNVAEWTGVAGTGGFRDDVEVCLVRFEELRADPAAVLGRIVGFLELPGGVDEARVRRAAEASTPERMADAARAELKRGIKSFRAGVKSLFEEPAEPVVASLGELGEEAEAGYARLVEEDELFAECVKRFGYVG